MYRGQSQDWPLLPSICRYNPREHGYEHWRVFQQDLLERFAKYARPLMSPLPTSLEEWLLHAQHYGVPSRLLDWTTNPLKALFFAVEDAAHATADGVVWAYTPMYWSDDPLKETTFSEEDLTCFYPKQLNPRIIAQEACFVAFPMPKTTAPLKSMESKDADYHAIDDLERITIPAKSKASLLRELRFLGMTHRSLYPDLQGLALNIKAELRAP